MKKGCRCYFFTYCCVPLGRCNDFITECIFNPTRPAIFVDCPTMFMLLLMLLLLLLLPLELVVVVGSVLLMKLWQLPRNGARIRPSPVHSIHSFVILAAVAAIIINAIYYCKLFRALFFFKLFFLFNTNSLSFLLNIFFSKLARFFLNHIYCEAVDLNWSQTVRRRRRSSLFRICARQFVTSEFSNISN